jgi:hypothetical protein
VQKAQLDRASFAPWFGKPSFIFLCNHSLKICGIGAVVLEKNITIVSAEKKTNRSPVARRLARWGTFSQRIARVLAALCLVVAAGFAMFTPEPLWQRLMSFVFLGLAPACVAYSIGWLLFWSLRGINAIYRTAIWSYG